MGERKRKNSLPPPFVLLLLLLLFSLVGYSSAQHYVNCSMSNHVFNCGYQSVSFVGGGSTLSCTSVSWTDITFNSLSFFFFLSLSHYIFLSYFQSTFHQILFIPIPPTPQITLSPPPPPPPLQDVVFLP